MSARSQFRKVPAILFIAAALFFVAMNLTNVQAGNSLQATRAATVASTRVAPSGGATVAASTYCSALAQRLGGLPVPNGDVCDVVVVRKTPIIKGSDGMNLNRFTLMNSVLEFSRTGMPENQAYVMGDFALLETEMNNVLKVVTKNGWTVTGVHNHMILEAPKTTFLHWETRGTIDALVTQINEAFAQTSIK